MPNIMHSRWLPLVIVYILAHGGIFFIPNAVYWDDWILINANSADVLQIFSQAGSFFNFFGYLHLGLLTIGPWFYKLLTFSLSLASGLLLYQILLRMDGVGERLARAIALLALATPFFASRIAVIVFPYTLCFFMFFLAWYLLDRCHWLALLLFFFSFNTQSLLVFYTLPILDLYLRTCAPKTLSATVRWGFDRIHLLLLPFVWFAIKLVYFQPSGVYSGYNENFGFGNVLPAATAQLKDFSNIDISVGTLLLSLGVMALAYSVFQIETCCQLDKRLSRRLVGAGTLALTLAVLPYWILRLAPAFEDWASRHQLLMPVGVAALIVAFSQFFRSEYRNGFIMAVLAIFVGYNWQNYLALYRDWEKQQLVMAFLHTSQQIAGADVVIFDDQTPNAFNRRTRFYEWNGMMKSVYGNEKRFSLDGVMLNKYRRGDYDVYMTRIYNAGEHIRRDKLKVLGLSITSVKGRPYVFRIIPKDDIELAKP